MDTQSARKEMVENQIVARGIRDPRVIQAMQKIPREKFLPERSKRFAYEDSALPIESRQTISQPYIVACMIEALQLTGGEKVLEIGTGSGYAAAVLAEIAGTVFTVERIRELADSASQRLNQLSCRNVNVSVGDGTRGWPDEAPFDAIVVTAGGPRVPDSLKSQLAIGGRLVIPVGSAHSQKLVRITRQSESKWKQEVIGGVRFVPLIGAEGWAHNKKP